IQHRHQIPGIGFARRFPPRGRTKKRNSHHQDEKYTLDRSRARPTLIGHEQHSPSSVSSARRRSYSLPRIRASHKIGKMGETVSLCPKADLARLRECCISSFDDAPLVERYLKNITGNPQG